MEGGILAVHCANKKVIPTFTKTFWEYLLRFNPGRDLTDETGLGGVFIPDEEYEMERNFVAMADQDNSKTMDIEEFEHFTNSNIIEPIFELLDETGDGVIEAAIEGKPFENISFRIL